MDEFFIAIRLDHAVDQVNEIDDICENKDDRRRAQHQDDFHEFAVDDASGLPGVKYTIQDQSDRSKRRAARKHEGNDSEEAEQCSLGDEGIDGAVEVFVQMGNQSL